MSPFVCSTAARWQLRPIPLSTGESRTVLSDLCTYLPGRELPSLSAVDCRAGSDIRAELCRLGVDR